MDSLGTCPSLAVDQSFVSSGLDEIYFRQWDKKYRAA